MNFEANCRTTAMGILPHTDVERALSLALSLDIPFWPQLPKVGYYEDMYAQIAEHFPGVAIDVAGERVDFDSARFYDELLAYADRIADPTTFDISERHSVVLHRFLERDLSGYVAIRGQTIGPVSFGLKIFDESLKPIAYNPDVRTVLFDFVQRKVNRQLELLRQKNANAFVWIDEPGLELLFSAFSGYTSEAAKEDMRAFLAGVDGLRAVHLCGNPDWDFLLTADINLLSFDCYGCGFVFIRYTDSVRRFLERGGVISWGLVPSKTEDFDREDLESLADRIDGYWAHLAGHGIDRELVVRQALLAPATCSLINADGAETVEKTYAMLREVSAVLRRRYRLD